MDSFFTRQGYSRPDATQRTSLCTVLHPLQDPDKSNWSEYPNIDYEVGNLMDGPN